MSFLLLTPDGEVRLLSEDTPFEDIQRIVSPKGKMVEVVSTVEVVGESRLNAYVDEEARIRGGSEVNLRASLVFGANSSATSWSLDPMTRMQRSIRV